MKDWIYSNGSYEGVEARKLNKVGHQDLYQGFWHLENGIGKTRMKVKKKKKGTKMKISLDAKTHI